MDARHSGRDARYPIFRDRADAGRQLGKALAAYQGQDVLVLGIPRGGIPVAAEVAHALGAELDAIVTRKIGAPLHEEFAIGAVTANGGLFLDQESISALRVDDAYLNATIQQESKVARDREARLRFAKPEPIIDGRVVLIVDDGLATGDTMRAAVRSVRKHRPRKIIAAIPVGSWQACASLQSEADEVVCLEVPRRFHSVGRYYEDFRPIEDDEVLQALEELSDAPGKTAPPTASYHGAPTD